jgi:hypothetical protein
MITAVGSDNHLFSVRVRTIFIPCMFLKVSVFIFVSGVSVFVSAST